MRRETVLRRADPVVVSTSPDGLVDLLLDGRWIRFPSSALAVLDAFGRPRTIEDAVAQVGARAADRQAWIDVTRAILVLCQHGVLVEADGVPSARGARGFATAAAHISLLNDRARTAAMLAAIDEVVQPGDVVVDIGSGCGVLAVAAARAGAAHVYAIEASTAAAAARALAEANGVAGRVTVIEGWSAQVDLPSRANVLVTEIAGNEPFGPQLLEVTIDARRRLLTADARVVPRRLRFFAQPVWIPDADFERVGFTPSATLRWREWYGLEFGGFDRALMLPDTVHVDAETVAAWPRLGEPLLVADVDLASIKEPIVDCSARATATSAGQANAVIGYTELQLSPSVCRSSSPYAAERGARWTIPVWLRTTPLALEAGEKYAVTLTYPGRTGRTAVSIDADR